MNCIRFVPFLPHSARCTRDLVGETWSKTSEGGKYSSLGDVLYRDDGGCYQARVTSSNATLPCFPGHGGSIGALKLLHGLHTALHLVRNQAFASLK